MKKENTKIQSIQSTVHPVYFGSLLTQLEHFLSIQKGRSLFVLTDAHTEKHCLPIVQSLLEQYGVKGYYSMPAGEQYKNLATCQAVWGQMLDCSLERGDLVVNVGGGVVGDLGGFAASAWKRGIGFIHIPTTLLAMTDAALGGKTGLDFKAVKNIIGAFQQPEAVFIDTVFLDTLPKEEIRSGMAEVVKHAWIGAPQIFDFLEKTRLEEVDWAWVLPTSIIVKMQIVEQDEKEGGLRKILNFGHTIGHAIEAYARLVERPIAHGHAVALGMVAELALVEPDSASHNRLREFVQQHFAPFQISASDRAMLWDFMKNDKKNKKGEVRFYVPGDIAFSMCAYVLEESVFERAAFDFFK